MTEVSTKSKNVITYLSSFFLFVFICIFTLSLLTCGIFANKSVIAKGLSSDTYVSGVYNDVNEYAADLCMKNNVDKSVLDGAMSKDDIKNIISIYVNNSLKGTKCDYQSDIAKIKDKLYDNAQKAYPNADKDKITAFCNDFSDYLLSITEFEYTSNFTMAVDKIQLVSYYSLVASLALIVAMIIIIARFNNKSQRFGAIADSLISSGVIALLFSICSFIIASVKDLYIFPQYLCDTVSEYVKWCIAASGITSLIILAVGIMFNSLGNKFKQD